MAAWVAGFTTPLGWRPWAAWKERVALAVVPIEAAGDLELVRGTLGSVPVFNEPAVEVVLPRSDGLERARRPVVAPDPGLPRGG